MRNIFTLHVTQCFTPKHKLSIILNHIHAFYSRKFKIKSIPTILVPCPLHLIGRGSRTPDKPIRKRVVVDPVLVLRGSATPTYSSVSVAEAVLSYNLLIESRGRLWGAFSAGIIEIYVV